jgi:hypothetical protein
MMHGVMLLLLLLLPTLGVGQRLHQALERSANPHGLILGGPAPLYRTLADTAGLRPVHRLRAGDKVIIRRSYSHWLAVSRTESTTRFGADTTTYWLPRTAMARAKVFVLL